MISPPLIVFALFVALLVWVSCRSVTSGIRYHRFFSRSLSKTLSDFTPFASVIVPCRGDEPGLRENLHAVFSQNYPHFEVVFVTGDATDASVPVIREFLSRPGTKLVFAGEAEGESQKVANLRAAVGQVSPESEVFAFVDSDARPGAAWLRSLVAELEHEDVGVSTGYRWFISQRRNFASELRACWNASVASRLGEDAANNFCWGGSTAIMRKRFEELRVSEVWRGSLSDDYQMMRTVRHAGLSIVFVPAAMCASVGDCSFRELMEFTTRQMKITRAYAPHLWISGLLGSFLFNLVVVWALILAVTGSGVAWLLAVSALSLIWGFSVGKAYVRLRAIGMAMPDFRPELKRQTLSQVSLWVLSPAVFLWNCLAALVSREIVWRGIRYRISSPERTEIVR